MKEKAKGMYAILIVPPKELIKKINEYRRKYAKYTEYQIVPHFTVFPPFYLKILDERGIAEQLSGEFVGYKEFNITLDSIGYFQGRNNVAFYKPDKRSTQKITSVLSKIYYSLKDNVENVFDDYNFTPEKFKPHMTIAERIPDKDLPSIKRELDNMDVSEEFRVEAVYLYKQTGNSKVWNEVEEISFK